MYNYSMLISEFYKNNPANYQTDKELGHCYLTQFYDNFFTSAHEKLKILEVGIYKGASVKLFSEFNDNFFVVGVDSTNIIDIPQSGKNYSIIFDNAYSSSCIENLKKTFGCFDLIIDDGSHTLNDQIYFVENYVELLSEQGTLLIEDIQSYENALSIWHKFQSGKVLDLRKINNQYDDILYVYKKN